MLRAFRQPVMRGPRDGSRRPGLRLQPELAGDAAGAAATAAEHADQLTGVEAEALEDARVLVRVDLVGQFAVGLLGLVVLAARPQQLEDLFLGYLHGSCVPAAAPGNPATVDSLTWLAVEADEEVGPDPHDGEYPAARGDGDVAVCACALAPRALQRGRARARSRFARGTRRALLRGPHDRRG